MLPFRNLLKPTTMFDWTYSLQQAFDQSKLAIIAEIKHGVTIFDKEKPTCLATDWSKHGITNWFILVLFHVVECHPHDHDVLRQCFHGHEGLFFSPPC